MNFLPKLAGCQNIDVKSSNFSNCKQYGKKTGQNEKHTSDPQVTIESDHYFHINYM